jgi:nitroimidazol reductase NimA-like FMN-containing flavoprotein (pyridoxamine 5'-phosphate oxidase superfamily)
MSDRPQSDVLRVRRQPTRGHYDRASVDAVLDAGLIAHVAFIEAGQPFCIPMLYARVADSLYIHGSVKSRLQRRLAEGVPACVTVTAVDGLVLARSAVEHCLL